MKKNGWIVLSLVGILLVTSSVVRADDKPEDKPQPNKSPQELLRDGDRYADQKDYKNALLRYKDAYEQIVHQLRGLQFKHPVTPNLMTRKDLRKRMVEIFDQEYDKAELRFMDRSLKAFDLVPESLDVRETMIGLYTEEVGGFYNPDNKNMVLISEGKEDQDEAKRGILARLFQTPSGFNKREQKITLAHEMTHAIQDQHYDLKSLHERAENDDDMALALSALAEGDATVVMFDEDQRMNGGQPIFHRSSPRMMDFAFYAMKTFMPFAAGKTFRNAPRIFKDGLIFPYHKGAVFVLHLTRKGGYRAVDRAWKDIPVSTEQILHPEKYMLDRDEPVDLELSEFESFAKWTRLGDNTMGEYQTRIVLSGISTASTASAGWDGDRYAIFEHDETEQTAMVWLTTWDSSLDAHQFALAYKEKLNRKLGLGQTEFEGKNSAIDEESESEDEDATEEQFEPLSFTIEKPTGVYAILEQGSDVLVLENVPADEIERIREDAFQAKRSTKSFAKK